MPTSDVVSGSRAERSLVASLSELLERAGFSVSVEPIGVLEWGEVECYIDELSCTAQPPIDTSRVHGRLGDDIPVYSTTADPDNVWVIYWTAVARGSLAVVFYDYYPGVGKRRIVVNEIPSYSFETRMRASRPAIHVPLIALPKLRRMKDVTISVKTVKRESTGYIVDSVIGGGEPRVAVITHHDRWLTGFRDNSVGILTILELARLLQRLRVPARMISFTAEEFGDPSEGSFYWAYGSRVYSRHLAEELDLAIVVDTAHREPVEVDCVGIDGTGSLVDYVESVRSDVGIGYTDAASMVRYGVPTLLFHNLGEIKPVYHTDADRYPGKQVESTVMKLARSIAKIAEEFRRGPPIDAYRAYIERVRRSAPPDVRTRLEACRDFITLSKCLTKHFTTLVIEGTYSDLGTQIRLLTYPEVLRGLEAGSEYTILEGDRRLGRSGLDDFRDDLRAAAEEVVRCCRS